MNTTTTVTAKDIVREFNAAVERTAGALAFHGCATPGLAQEMIDAVRHAVAWQSGPRTVTVKMTEFHYLASDLLDEAAEAAGLWNAHIHSTGRFAILNW